MDNSQRILEEGNRLADQILVYGQGRGLCLSELISALAVAECTIGWAFDTDSGCRQSATIAMSVGHALFHSARNPTFEN